MKLSKTLKRRVIQTVCVLLGIIISLLLAQIGKKHTFILENKKIEKDGQMYYPKTKEVSVEFNHIKKKIRVLPNFNQSLESHGFLYKIKVYTKTTPPQLLKEKRFRIDNDIETYNISLPLLLANFDEFFEPVLDLPK